MFHSSEMYLNELILYAQWIIAAVTFLECLSSGLRGGSNCNLRLQRLSLAPLSPGGDDYCQISLYSSIHGTNSWQSCLISGLWKINITHPRGGICFGSLRLRWSSRKTWTVTVRDRLNGLINAFDSPFHTFSIKERTICSFLPYITSLAEWPIRIRHAIVLTRPDYSDWQWTDGWIDGWIEWDGAAPPADSV